MKYIASFLLSILLVVSPALAQETWQHYTNSTTPNCMIADGQYLWIGTSGGLVKFDRATRSYTVLHPSNSGILMNAVMSLNKDRDGGLWVGSRGAGVAHLHDGKWTHFTSKDHNFGSGVIWTMSTDSSGTVWIGCDSGLVSYKDGSFSRITMDSAPFESNSIYALTTDRNGGLWVGTQTSGAHSADRASVLRLKDDVWELHNKSTDVKYPSGSPVAIYEATNGDLWFGCQSKVSRLRGKTWETFAAIPSDGLYNYVYGLNEDADGVMYMTTSYGASRFDGSKWSVMTDYPLASGIAILRCDDGLWFCASQIDGIAVLKDNSWKAYHELSHTALPTNYVNAMTIDSKGVYWFGGNGNELTSFDGEIWKQYQFLDADTERVSALAADSSGNLWIGMLSTGFCKWDGATVTRFNRSNSPMISNNVFTIAYDKMRNGLWLGGRIDQKSDSTVKGSLLFYGGDTWKNYYPANSDMPWVEFNDIEIDPKGDLWIAFPYFGVSRFNGDDKWTTFNAENSNIPSNMTNALAIDHTGQIWLATNSGAAKYDGSTWTSFTKAKDGIGSDILMSVAVDSADRVWFGANYDYDGGLLSFKDNSWKHYTVFNSPVGSLLVLKLISDAKGNIYAGTTDAGVAVVNVNSTSSSVATSQPEHTLIFPNPATDRVTLRLANNSTAVISVRDLLGRDVLVQQASGKDAELDLSSLLPGVYFVCIEQDGLSQVERLVLE